MAQASDNNLGIIVPVDLEALCIGKSPGAIFKQPPFDFTKLNVPPYLSETAQLAGNTTQEQGVHLHWALPDAITHGDQTADNTNFPSIPDRWLISRVFSDPNGTEPLVVERWVIESNYYSEDDPNITEGRFSINTTYNPYNAEGRLGTPWRYLGRVLAYDDWKDTPGATPTTDDYLSELTSVGYGTADFAAGYQNCKSVLGFTDLGDDLEKLAGSADKELSYHILGWYSNPDNDPIRKLPQTLSESEFQEVDANIPEGADKDFFEQYYPITAYILKTDLPNDASAILRGIFLSIDYPIEMEVPETFTADEFNDILNSITDPAEKQYVEDSYEPQYGLTDLPDDQQSNMWQIMADAGYGFLNGALSYNRWSLPSSNAVYPNAPSYSLYTGLITGITWNADTNYFTNDPGEDFNIAIGNTPEEAMSALVADSGTYEDPELIEDLLNALQTGLLDEVNSETVLKDWEALKATLHQNSFQSNSGGDLWQVQENVVQEDTDGEITLSDGVAEALNELNLIQQTANELQRSIDLQRQQVYDDWYKFMLVYHDKHEGPNPSAIAPYLDKKMDLLNSDDDLLATTLEDLATKKDELQSLLPNTQVLTTVTAPRYWIPNDPVVLFQGNGINPSDRFGNDGRYMYNHTLLCRLTNQLNTSVGIPADAFDTPNDLTLNASSFSAYSIDNPDNLALIDGMNATWLDAMLLDPNVLSQSLIQAESGYSYSELMPMVEEKLNGYLNPAILESMSVDLYEQIIGTISSDDQAFMAIMYIPDGDNYVLAIPLEDVTDSETLHLKYILDSVQVDLVSALVYEGLPMSLVGFFIWTENPWLPFSLDWTVHYFPMYDISDTGENYAPDFITSNFVIGDTNLEYTGDPIDIGDTGIHPYIGSIFLTPHANINLKYQIEVFILQNEQALESLPELKKLLENILTQLDDKPVLSQALSGFNNALVMLKEELQLQVADPNADGAYYELSNTRVPAAVQDTNSVQPIPQSSYNPIRTGLGQLISVEINDVFGRNVHIDNPANIIRAQSMIQTTIEPDGDAYFTPRLAQPARLLFRWLSADDDMVEMNSHPATTPICGWVLANHLDVSLWVYDNTGNPYGSMILNNDNTRIIWQCTPGSPYFGESLEEFLNTEGLDVNEHFKSFLLSLYGTDGDNAAYLQAFLQALDDASSTIDPANQGQYQSNAVLMGRPYALTRASLDLNLEGGSSYSQSWENFDEVVMNYDATDEYSPGNNYEFPNVEFPVKLGNIPQTEDGLVGYFKDDDYNVFYAPASEDTGHGVQPPGPNNITLESKTEDAAEIVSILLEPRGKVYASTGILPVKTIEIPPDQYVDALLKLNLCFLTSPILTSRSALSMPLPAQSGGQWSWVENEGTTWSSKQEINPVNTLGTMNYYPQRVVEGWLNLANNVITGNNYSLLNMGSDKAELYVTADPSENILSLQIINTFDFPLKLNGGTPVFGPYENQGSSFVFSFGALLSSDVSKNLSIIVDNGSWQNLYDEESESWAIAPDDDMEIAVGQMVSFTLSNITVESGTVSGNVTMSNYGLPDLPDSLAPIDLFMEVIETPTLSRTYLETNESTMKFNSTDFVLSNPDESYDNPVLFITDDGSENILQLVFTNNTGQDLTLTGGTPVIETQEQAASTFSIDFSEILTEEETGAIEISDKNNEWAGLFFPSASAIEPPKWGLAPVNDLTLVAGGTVTFTLTNIACSTDVPDNFEILYYNFDGVTSRDYAMVYPISLLNLPSGSVLPVSMAITDVVHPIVKSTGTTEVALTENNTTTPVVITYDSSYPIENGFTLTFLNTSNQDLNPSATEGTLSPSVTISFLLGESGNAITTPEAGLTIDVSVEAPEDYPWDGSTEGSSSQNWVFTPKTDAILGPKETVKFIVSDLITSADDGFSAGEISPLSIQTNNFPGYDDAVTVFQLEKEDAVATIDTFTMIPASPASINYGENVQLSWVTQQAWRVTLEYNIRDADPDNPNICPDNEQMICLDSENGDIQLDETNFQPPTAPTAPSTLFKLTVYGQSTEPADQDEITLTVLQPGATIKTFDANPALVDTTNGDSSTEIAIDVEQAKAIMLNSTAIPVTGIETSVTETISISKSIYFTLDVTQWNTSDHKIDQLLVIAYDNYHTVDVGAAGDGTSFQSLPLALTNTHKKRIYAANGNTNCVYQVDQVNLDNPSVPPVFTGSVMAVTDNGNWLFVADIPDEGGSTMGMYSTDAPTSPSPAAASSTSEIPGPPPYAMATNPANTMLVAGAHGSENEIYTWDFSTGALGSPQTQNVENGNGPRAFAFSADGAVLYVANYESATVSIFNVANNTVTLDVVVSTTDYNADATQPRDLKLVGTDLFVACSGSNLVLTLNTDSKAFTNAIVVGSRPFSLELNKSNSMIYVANFGADSVSVIQVSDYTVPYTLTVGNAPASTHISDNGILLFVSNYCDKSLSVVDISGTVPQVVPGAISLGTQGNPIDISTYDDTNGYTNVFVAKEYFLERTDSCSETMTGNLTMSVLSIQEPTNTKGKTEN